MNLSERAAAGKAARSQAPRSAHAEWESPADRADPVAILEQQARSRVPELVPIRYGRMAVSPFTFYRGAAAVMAADLVQTPVSGLRVQACGDAHLSNFGAFAAPDRRLVFDLNDFDETLPGPWEWDLKRLAASFEIAGRGNEFRRKERRSVVRTVAREYREAMRGFAGLRNLEVWYARLDAEAVLQLLRAEGDKLVRKAEKGVAKAHAKDSLRALDRLTHEVDGELRIVSKPPLIVPVEELLSGDERFDIEAAIREVIERYGESLKGDRRHLLETYRFRHMARKVVGVGSVGTRVWIVLLTGRDDGDPLILQAKEAQASVLEPHVGRSSFDNHGQRVVEGQWLMQAASDSFLGWCPTTGMDDRRRDFYVRQLWDGKGSTDVDAMTPRTMEIYARMCGWTLARAHARSGDAVAIGAYLGSGDAFDAAITEFSALYADQNERDHAALVAAIESGRIEAEDA
ncbi:MAG TPA: DUF2252 domain-containing protein [Solirubrobacterales bacterium]|nr:DUF2252 domain-containing protein [Solirubrobacterales bacterium]